MKKVYHIHLSNGVFKNGGWQKAFEENGYEYHVINWQQTKLKYGQGKMWQLIFDECEKIKPDLIFSQIQKPNILRRYEAEKLSHYGFTVNYTMDVREDLSWFEEIAPYMGLLLFCDYDSIEQMKGKGFYNCDYMQQSCDIDFYKPIETDKNYGEIIFIGNRYDNTNLNFPFAKERTEMVNFMKQEFGERFQAYGRGYGKILNQYEEREAYNSCKIAITQNLFHRKGYSSDRIWRALFCNALMVSKFYDSNNKFEILPFFYKWDDFIELAVICNAILGGEQVEINEKYQLFNNLYNRKYYSWSNRIKQLNSLLKKHSVNELCKHTSTK